MANDTTTVETTKEVTGKLVPSLTLPTPAWATWIFRIVFLLTTAATIIIAGDSSIHDDIKVKIMLYMKGFDVVIWGLGRSIGIDKKQFEEQ